MLSSVDVHNYLQERDIPHEFFKLEKHARSLEQAAAALGIVPSQVARVEILKVDGDPVMVICTGDRRVDPDKVRLSSGGSVVEKASVGETTRITGFLPRAVPPLALNAGIKVLVDFYALKEEVLYGGSGDTGSILKIRSYDIVRANDADTVDVTVDASDGGA